MLNSADFVAVPLHSGHASDAALGAFFFEEP